MNELALSQNALVWHRFKQSGLITPFAAATACASALGGIQAQILSAAALALWNRLPNFSHADFEALLYEQRQLVKIWSHRGTLHLHPSAEWPLIHALYADRISCREKALEESGGSVAFYRQTICDIAAMARQRTSIGRSDLRKSDLQLHENSLSSWGGIFYDLVRHGWLCHVRASGAEGRFAHREVWLPDLPWQPPTAQTAHTTALRQYFSAYGPATVQDAAYWLGTTAAVVRVRLAALETELTRIVAGDKSYLMLTADIAKVELEAPTPDKWPVLLLYRFDPLLLSHKDKQWLIDPKFYKNVWQAAGHVEGTVLIKGRIAGTWRYLRRGNGLSIEVRPFHKLARRHEAKIERRAQHVAAFFDRPLRDFVIAPVDPYVR